VLDKHLASITTQRSFFIENNKKGVTASHLNLLERAKGFEPSTHGLVNLGLTINSVTQKPLIIWVAGGLSL